MFKLPQRRANPLLWSVIMVSVVVHVLALLIAGGITIYHYAMPPEPSFDAPLPHETIERQRLDMSVRLQQQQQRTQRPTERLQVTTPAQVTVPDMDIRVPDLNARVAVAGLGGSGRGADIGGAGGLSIGAVTVDILGVKSQGEKFLFIIDANRELMVDARGGMPTYNVIKEDLIRAVNELPTAALFNAMIYEQRRILVWSDRLRSASQDNKDAFAEWLRPINTDFERLGVRETNFKPEKLFGRLGEYILREPNYFPHPFFHTLAAGFELTPDTIFWLSPNAASWDSVRLVEVTDEDREAARARQAENIRESPFETEEEWRESLTEFNQKVSEAVRRYKQRENETREARGIPPRVYSNQENWQLVQRMRTQVAEEIGAPNPHQITVHPRQTVTRIPEREAKQWAEQYQRLIFDERRLERPTVNLIIFKGADEPWDRNTDDRRVREFVREFNGDFRVLRGLGQIEVR